MNQTISYDAFEDDLKAFLDGELPLFRRVQMRLHLAQCAHCAKELKTMQTISEELQTETAPPLEADLRAKILQNVPEAGPQAKPSAPSPLVRKTSWRLIPTLGVSAILIGIMATMFFPMFGRARENARHSSVKSELRQIPGGGGQYNQDYDQTYGNSDAPSAAAGAASPRRGESASTDSLKTNGYGSATYRDVVPQQRAVHKQGSLSVAVDDAEARSGEVEILVKNVGGFVANNALSTGGDGRKSATLDVRVPVTSFESIVSKIGKLGTVREKSVNGEDVTQRVTAAGVQRESLARELSIREAQLRALSSKKVAQRQIAIADVRQLRFQAAQARAQLEYLRKYAALSTLYVTLQDKQKVVTPTSFSGAMSQTGHEAWSSFIGAAKLPVQLLIWILAYCPLWIPALIIWRKWGRKLLSAG